MLKGGATSSAPTVIPRAHIAMKTSYVLKVFAAQYAHPTVYEQMDHTSPPQRSSESTA